MSKNICKALIEAQAELENPKNTAANPMFKSKYAPLDVVINTVRPVLAKHGLGFIQRTGTDGEHITVQTVLLHESGEMLESDVMSLPGVQSRSGNVKEFNAQGCGSALTYARRYSLTAMLGIASEDDDDGNQAPSGKGAPKKPVTLEQALVTAAKRRKISVGELTEMICKSYNVENLSNIPESIKNDIISKLGV